MKKGFASILMTSYNKSEFLLKSINSCLNQNYKTKEILIFDDCSLDSSRQILKNINKKNTFVTFNKKKKYKSGPLNQLYATKNLFSRSKGEIIFLIDSDDYYKKNKIKYIVKYFKSNKNLNFIQDTPKYGNVEKIFKFKRKKNSFTIWPSVYPTSCLAIKRKFFLNFLKLSKQGEFPNLEIDARLCIYAFLKNEYSSIKKNFTIYNFDENGITSMYKKFTFNWWRKRNEAYDYMKFLMKKMNKKFIPGYDYYFTKLVNCFIKNEIH